jgi:hypothetical protein
LKENDIYSINKISTSWKYYPIFKSIFAQIFVK